MAYIFDANGKLIHTSQNLRGIMDYARKHVPTHASITHNSFAEKDGSEPPYRVCIFFDNGACGFSHFQDWRVFRDWIKSRRSWKAVAGPSFEVRYGGIEGMTEPEYPYA